MAITREQYLEAYQIVRQYELEQHEIWLEGLKKPCPGCGGKTNDSGDCRKCGIVYLNGVHSINTCTKFHTHSNDCMVPFEGWEKIKVSLDEPSNEEQNSGQLPKADVMESVCELHDWKGGDETNLCDCGKGDGTCKREQTAP